VKPTNRWQHRLVYLHFTVRKTNESQTITFSKKIHSAPINYHIKEVQNKKRKFGQQVGTHQSKHAYTH
jgi:hypothetical protein